MIHMTLIMHDALLLIRNIKPMHMCVFAFLILEADSPLYMQSSLLIVASNNPFFVSNSILIDIFKSFTYSRDQYSGIFMLE